VRAFINLHAEGDGFVPPSTNDFNLPPVSESIAWLTKPVLLVFLSVILVSVFFVLSSRKAAIGHDFMRFVPYLFTLFTFVLTNNIFGIIPFLQFPAMSHVGFPYVLAIFTFVVFHYVGIRKQGLIKYLKEIAFMPGVPKPVYILLTPIELATFFLVRPLTLSLRLFANMFAGHLLLLVFIMGGDYMLHDSHLIMKLFSPFSFAFGIALTFFEFMVQCLQAYIFTLLTALYIAGALADEH
jgi:F-type H+-transporting ATPase subunit a